MGRTWNEDGGEMSELAGRIIISTRALECIATSRTRSSNCGTSWRDADRACRPFAPASP